MAKQKLKKNKNGLQVLKLNREELNRQYCLKKGEPLTNTTLSKSTGYSMVVLKTWESELPQAISVLNYLMKEMNMTFEEITQLVYE